MDAIRLPIYGGRYFASSDGHIYNAFGKRLKPAKSSSGYLTVNLYISGPGESKSFLVHRLVAKAFLGESALTVNHIDGDKLNNQLSNLEYLSLADNVRHAAKVLRAFDGEKNHQCRLTSDQVKEIRRSPLSGVDVAKQFGVSAEYVYRIRRFQARKDESEAAS